MRYVFIYFQVLWAVVSRTHTFSFLTCESIVELSLGLVWSLEQGLPVSALVCERSPPVVSAQRNVPLVDVCRPLKSHHFSSTQSASTVPDLHLTLGSLGDCTGCGMTQISWASSFSSGKFLQISSP